MDDEFIGAVVDCASSGGGGNDGPMSFLLAIVGIPLLIASPFIMCSESKRKAEVAEQKRIEKINDPRSMAEKAGEKTRRVVVDFGKGLVFGKKKEE